MIFSRDPLADPKPLIRRVYAYVAYRIGDGPEAEDVTSETFERALRYRDTFDPRKGDAASWLIGIARRCIAGAYERNVIVDGDPPERTAAGDLEADAVRRLDLTAGLAELETRDRELLALRYGGDLTAAQIAEIIELRPNTVEVALHRALARLREALERPEEAEEALEPRRVSAG